MPARLLDPPADGAVVDVDVVVAGAGCAGLSAALMASLEGARVLLLERTAHVGGTSAWSAGTTWIPGTHHNRAAAPEDTPANALAFLDRAVGAQADPALRRAFLEHGAEVVACYEARTEVRYRPYARHPDYLSEVAGSVLAGRALEPLPFDGRRLGALFDLLRPPIPEFTVLGGMMVDRTDIGHLLGATRSRASFAHAARLLARHARDRLTHRRGTRLVMGNALVGRLLFSLAAQPQARLLVGAAVRALERDAGGAVRLAVEHAGRTLRVRAAGGLVLASGGFNRHPERRAAMLPGTPADWCVGAPGHTGELHALAEAAGAHYGTGAPTHAFWAPVSMRVRADGSRAVFPHFVLDRSKPGTFVVDQAGRRFVNESTSYHLFSLAMQAAHRTTPTIPAFLVADAPTLARYGLGMVRPGGRGLGPHLADGYLVRGATLDALAARLGIDAAALADTVARMNRFAATGVDADFGRGSTAYQRHNGDATAGTRNPCLGPIGTPPYYAVRLYPGDIGAATGFAADADGRLLDRAGAPIPGLYAAGNDMQSIMGGVYVAPGITLGPGLVFGALAGRHAAARARAASAGGAGGAGGA
ncbi:MAG: FAD-dependent oxidoreductase [Burkholderiales bacterium]|nr:FAD-dependent oxidoreductase [Burkholderiales bacterium]